MLTPQNTNMFWRLYDVIVIKTPEKWFAVCLMHLEPDLFWNGEESSCLNVPQRRLYTDIFILNVTVKSMIFFKKHGYNSNVQS